MQHRRGLPPRPVPVRPGGAADEVVIGELDLQCVRHGAVELERPTGRLGAARALAGSGSGGGGGGEQEQERGGEGDEGEDGAEEVRREEEVGLPRLQLLPGRDGGGRAVVAQRRPSSWCASCSAPASALQ